MLVLSELPTLDTEEGPMDLCPHLKGTPNQHALGLDYEECPHCEEEICLACYDRALTTRTCPVKMRREIRG